MGRITVNPPNPILIADELESSIKQIKKVLSKSGMNNLIVCQQGRLILDCLAKYRFSAALLSDTLVSLNGNSLMSNIKNRHPYLPIILLAEKNDFDSMLTSMKTGAFDCVTKPFANARLHSAVTRAVESGYLVCENIALRNRLLTEKLDNPESFSIMLTRNRTMISIFRYAESIAPKRDPVFITGETGVGKKLLATAIHRLSGLKGKLVVVELSDADDSVFAEKIFGVTTKIRQGAKSVVRGGLDLSKNGTLFIDGLDRLSKKSQSVLLNLLNEGEYDYPDGAPYKKYTLSRMIASCSGTMEELMKSDGIHPDLLLKLQDNHVHIPPLRERIEDIPMLVDHFIELAMKECKRRMRKKPLLAREVLTQLSTYHFSNGNVKELRKMVFEAISKHGSGRLSAATIRKHIENSGGIENRPEYVIPSPFSGLPQLPTIKEATKLLIMEAMKRANGNQSVAAGLLGISQPALSYHLKKELAEQAE